MKKQWIAALLLAGMSFHALADGFPSRPINLVVPYAAGGGTDTAARMLAKRLTERLGQQVVVENKAGGATQIGTSYVVRAQPDGYTLLMGTANLATNTAFYDKLPYDVSRDLVAVAQVTDVPIYLFGGAGGPFRNAKEFLAAGATKPGVVYATAGIGSIPHLTGEILARQASLSLTHVPYKGSAEAVVAVAGGQVPASFDNLAPAYAQVKAGRLLPLAIAAQERSPALPQVPTLQELGYPVAASSWWGVMAPTGTPSTVIDLLNREINAVLQEPDVRTYFIAQGIHPVGGTAKAFADYIATETRKWQAIVRDANIRLDQ